MSNDGRSPSGQATRASPEPASSLGHSASVLNAGRDFAKPLSPPWSPGPWSMGCFVRNPPGKGCQCTYLFDDGHTGGIGEVYVDNGRNIADGGNGAPQREQAIANAHLMAAAPDLYDALYALNWLFAEDDPALAQARAALAKASGVTNDT